MLLVNFILFLDIRMIRKQKFFAAHKIPKNYNGLLCATRYKFQNCLQGWVTNTKKIPFNRLNNTKQTDNRGFCSISPSFCNRTSSPIRVSDWSSDSSNQCGVHYDFAALTYQSKPQKSSQVSVYYHVLFREKHLRTVSQGWTATKLTSLDIHDFLIKKNVHQKLLFYIFYKIRVLFYEIMILRCSPSGRWNLFSKLSVLFWSNLNNYNWFFLYI